MFPVGSAAPRIIRVYPLDVDGGDLVRAHWRNETRALLRLSSTEHPSLPRFREGTYLEKERLGFVILDDVGVPVRDAHPVGVLLRRSPLAAFRRWFALLEATMLVQDEGLIHRSISPLAACALEDEDAPIVLDGFQMSAFVSTWLSAGLKTDPSWRGALDAPTLACLSPERAGPLVGLPRKLSEGLRSDVFGLGMLGMLWFASPPADWGSGFVVDTYSEETHRTVVAEARAILAASSAPRPLKQLLAAMTEFEPANRIPGARVAYEEAAKLYGAILRVLSEREETSASPRHLYYLKESIERLYADSRANSAPQHPDYEEYNEYIARDLDAGTVVWSPDGFRPWDTSTRDSRTSQAKIVLLGREYAYFAQLRDQGSAEETDRALVIKYVLPVHRVRELRNAPRAAPMPTVRLEFFAAGSRIRPAASGPKWAPILDAVRMDASQLVGPPVVRASQWLLGAQRALLAARQYRFERDDDAPEALILRQQPDDEKVDEETQDGAFLSLVRENVRAAPMGDLFEGVHRYAEELDETAYFEFFEKRGDVPSTTRLVFEERLDDYTVRFRSSAAAVAAVPPRGYVRPVDSGRFVQSRQWQALGTLETRQRHLAAQLAAPTGVRIRDDSPLPPADDTTGALVHLVRETWPFFAIQGPPGTGKTFVAARVIEAVLHDDPFARVLVSAQSHHAVDNLLTEVAHAQRDEIILLRVATERTRSKVAPDNTGFLAQSVLDRLRDGAKKAAGQAGKDLAPLPKRWRKAVSDYEVDADLAQRMTRAASVVFATCAGAGSRELEDQGVSFDWIVAEEAARGWLTEFLVPLVRGTRWLMLGDQAQLPAFGRNEVNVLLAKDAELRRTEATTGSPVDPRWRETFLRHFAHAVDGGKKARVPTACTLTVQRRMHPQIGELIGRTFYGGDLQHHPDTVNRHHGTTVPGLDPSAAFVWIDTTPLRQAGWERGLVNDAEVRLMGYLLSQGVKPIRHNARIPPLFVLTPYWAQVRALKNYVRQLQGDEIRTVDSVQGRQAEIVMVSLVRNNAASGVKAGVGFLEEPERVNVMFSRARRLLIVVGSLAHFERFGVPHWRDIAAYARSDRRFLVDVGATGFHVGAGRGPY